MKSTFELTAEFIALNDLLKVAGLCDSSGAGKAMVARAEVTVNGELEMRKTRKVRAGDTVRVAQHEITVKARSA